MENEKKRGRPRGRNYPHHVTIPLTEEQYKEASGWNNTTAECRKRLFEFENINHAKIILERELFDTRGKLEFLIKLIEEGKIRAVNLSNFEKKRIEAM